MAPAATRSVTIKALPVTWHMAIKKRAAEKRMFDKDVILDVFEAGMKRRGMLPDGATK